VAERTDFVEGADNAAQAPQAVRQPFSGDDVLTEECDDAAQDTWFNPYRLPKSERAWAVVRDVVNQVQNLEQHDGLRKRARRQLDQERFEASVAAIIADLIHFHLCSSPGGLVITRSKTVLGRRSRYRPPVYNRTIPDILDRLARPEMAFIEQSKGRQLSFDGPSRRTTIRPGPRLVRRIHDHGLTFDDLTVSGDGELIHLKGTRRGWWDEADLIDYDETETTARYRDEMRAINTWLAAADLSFDHSAFPELNVDVSERRLRRVFTRGSFESGGRLFGGFWQPLKKPQRRSGVRINGEQINVLDYSQMAPMIAYGLANTTPPVYDMYRVPGYEDETLRPGMKKFFNAMLFSLKPIRRMPNELRAYLPAPISATELADAIVHYHPSLTFFQGLGHHIQFYESQIMVSVLLDLKTQGIVALPIHDAVAVPKSRMEAVREVMADHFRPITGIEIKVNEETD
jgi:hypothetical protein